MLKKLPPRAPLVGRIRRDAELFFLPTLRHRRSNGSAAPHCYRRAVRSCCALRKLFHGFRSTSPSVASPVNCASNAWDLSCGALLDAHCMQLVVIAPVGYRLRKNLKPLPSAPPSHLYGCQLDLQWIVQGYIQRSGMKSTSRKSLCLVSGKRRYAMSSPWRPCLPCRWPPTPCSSWQLSTLSTRTAS